MNNENSPNTTTLENFQNLGINVLERKASLQVTGGVILSESMDALSGEPMVDTAVETTSPNDTIALDLGTLDLL